MTDISKLNVLIADDNNFERGLIAAMVKRLGVGSVVDCASGGEALRILSGETPVDLLICDLQMPDTDGVELLRQVATEYPGLSVIIMSALDDRLRGSVERMAAESGIHITGNLAKPVTPEKLLPMLSECERAPMQEGLPEFSEAEIRRALETDQFYILLQPKVELATCALKGAEALIRWRHPVHGLVPPDAFIPVVEHSISPVIDELTDKVFSMAVRALRTLHASGMDLRLSVNVAARTLQQLDLPDRLSSLLRDNGLSPRHLIVEVTESGLMHNLAETLDVLTRLRLKDIELSIDDFGTGYSSLQQLQRVPFDELKIDKSFLADTREARAILESSIRLGKKLELTTVVEGIETQRDWDLVAGLGCDVGQGYFIAAPMPVTEMPLWQDQWLQTAKDKTA